MKVGGLTKLDNVTFTSTVTANAGFEEDNIIDNDTLHLWQVTEGTVSLTLSCDSISANSLGLFNINIEDEIRIIIKNSSAVTLYDSTSDIDTTKLNGIDKKHYILEFGSSLSDIVSIELTTNGATSSFLTSIGYISVFDITDWGCVEALQPFDLSADTATIVRTGSSDTKREYITRRYNIGTTKTNQFSTTQGYVRDVLQTGYATKRPFLIADFPYPTTSPEMFLGIFDSGTFGYDVPKDTPDDTAANAYAQLQLGLREVF